MGKRALNAGLGLLTIALILGPIVLAFGTHGWGLRETVFPSENQMDDIRDRVEDLMGDSETNEETFSVTGSEINGDDFSVSLDFTSPLNFRIVLEEIEGTLSEGGVKLGSIELVEENVEIEKGETKSITLDGVLTEQGKSRIKDIHGGEVPADVELSEGILRFRASGVSVEISLENISGV